jgi:hypothetical protein
MDKARNRIQSELPADGAVRADPGNKPSAAGVQASEFKPKVGTKPSGAPPEPGKPNFPKRPADQPALTNPLSRSKGGLLTPSLRGAKRRPVYACFTSFAGSGVRGRSESEGGSNPASLRQQSWIASRSLSSGAHSRDPLARNDGEDNRSRRQ